MPEIDNMYNPLNNRSLRDAVFRLRGWPAWLALAGALVAACGGVGTEGTGSFASGPITGFGSIVVNGIHFDESTARVEDETGSASNRGALKLGMVVEIEGGAVNTDSNGSSATASRVRFASELAGPVDSVSIANGTLSVLGRNVLVGAGTVFDSAFGGGLDRVALHAEVEIYGFPGAAPGTVLATRIELRPSEGVRKIRGIVSALDTQSKTFRIDSALFFYGAATGIPAALANNVFVRLRLQPAPDGQGRWVVSAFNDAVPRPSGQARVELEGVVTAFNTAQSFSVNGLVVDASGVVPVGGSVIAGARVEVEGTSSNGVLVAQKVKVQSEDETSEFEFRGTIASVDAVAQTFTLAGRSEIIHYALDLRPENGTLGDLIKDRQVEVQGALSADRTRLEAKQIKFLR